MSFLRWLLRLFSGLTQFALYSMLFFVLMVGAGYWVALQFFGGEEIKAPDLGGLSTVQALEKLQPNHISLELERRQPHVQVPDGHIISQYPTANAVIKSGTPIRVVISSGSPLVPVPDLRGRNKIEAGIRLRKAGLEVGSFAMIERAGVPGGTVLTTDPPGGAGAISGSKVNLLIAAGEGAGPRQMPNLVGLTRDEAAEVLASYNLKIGDVREAPSGDADMPAGHVHSQTPSPGETVSPVTTISVVVQPAYSDQPSTTSQGNEGLPSSFYRDPNENTFKGNDDSQTFRGEGESPRREANPEATPEPTAERTPSNAEAPPVETPEPEKKSDDTPSVNLDFGQREPATGQN